jgi:hypothetical protein
MILQVFLGWKRKTPSLAGANFFRLSIPHASSNHRSYSNTKLPHKPWSSGESEKLLSLWNQGLKLRDMTPLLGRTYRAINARVLELRKVGQLGRRFGSPFTPLEDAVVLEGARNRLSWKQCASKMPGRTAAQVQNRRKHLFRKARVFCTDPLTPTEVQHLLELRDEQRLSWVKIGQILSGRGPKQSRDFYNTRICPSTKTIIPLSRSAIPSWAERAHALKAEGNSRKEIAHILGVPYTSVVRMFLQAAARGPEPDTSSGRNRRWTAAEVDELVAHKAKGVPNKDLSAKLRRTIVAIQRKWHAVRKGKVEQPPIKP